jgi:hypothetical protein
LNQDDASITTATAKPTTTRRPPTSSAVTSNPDQSNRGAGCSSTTSPTDSSVSVAPGCWLSRSGRIDSATEAKPRRSNPAIRVVVRPATTIDPKNQTTFPAAPFRTGTVSKTSAPAALTCPPVGLVMVARIRINDDLPAPFGPSSPRTPAPTPRVRSRTAWTPPRYTLLTPLNSRYMWRR